MKRDGFSEDASTDSELGTSALLDDSGVYISDDDEMYDPNKDDKCDVEAKINQFVKEWVESLNRDDTMAISGVLFSIYPVLFC